MRRELEAAADTAFGVEQPGLVDAAGAQFGVHTQLGVKGFRQEVQVAGDGAGFLGTLTVLFDPAALVLSVRHHQQRAGELLIEASALGNIAQHAVAHGLAFVDQAVDQQYRDEQQQHQHGDHAEFETEGLVHVASCGSGRSVCALRGGFVERVCDLRVFGAAVQPPAISANAPQRQPQPHPYPAIDVVHRQGPAVQLHHLGHEVQPQPGALAPAPGSRQQ